MNKQPLSNKNQWEVVYLLLVIPRETFYCSEVGITLLGRLNGDWGFFKVSHLFQMSLLMNYVKKNKKCTLCIWIYNWSPGLLLPVTVEIVYGLNAIWIGHVICEEKLPWKWPTIFYKTQCDNISPVQIGFHEKKWRLFWSVSVGLWVQGHISIHHTSL